MRGMRNPAAYPERFWLKPGNANLPIGGLHDTIQENGVPGRHLQVILRPSRSERLTVTASRPSFRVRIESREKCKLESPYQIASPTAIGFACDGARA